MARREQEAGENGEGQDQVTRREDGSWAPI